MAEPKQADVEVDILINAAPETVYALVTDLATLTELAEEPTAMTWRKGASVQPGAVFTGDNRNGSHTWTTTCTVTDADPGRRFAFDVKFAVLRVSRWQYDFEPTEGGCRVVERTWDRRPKWFTKIAPRATGVPDREAANAEHMRVTLGRLKEAAEQRVS